MNIEAALEKLYSLHTFGIKLGLENITRFLDYLGNPQKKLKTFHIAGSNGKGSTASFIASILMEFGFKVGLYTSPHFIKFNERIQINGVLVPDDYLAKFMENYLDYIEEYKLTFFEVTTAIAFKYFLEQKVDYAVIETGLGGRLDATNVLNPLAIIITSISLEHTNILGNTIPVIAGEKAAIIKNNSRVFTGKLPPAAEKVVENKCKETNSRLYKIEDYLNIKKHALELYTEEIELDDWKMPLKGNYQKYNAALAGLVVSKILLKSDLNIMTKGFKNVIKNTGLQGRFEYYSLKPVIIFDSAHNPDGIDNFLSEFKTEMIKYSKRIVLFGVMRDKSIKEMLSRLCSFFDEIHITQVQNERSAKIEELLEITRELNIKDFPEPDPFAFIKKFKERKSNDCLVVLGSMYLIGEIKSEIQKYKIA